MDFWRNEWNRTADTTAATSLERLINTEEISNILIIVTAQIVGKAYTWSYPDNDGFIYEIPTYKLSLNGVLNGKQKTHVYEVIRFGVSRKSEKSAPHVVGLADKQRHVIKRWIPTYKVHSTEYSTENGAWQVYNNFLIHDGPDDPMSGEYASVGCIEICGPSGFVNFNNDIISLSGIKKNNREMQLEIIGKSGKLLIEYEKAERPPLLKVI